jgi:hypothetical protein
MQRTIEHRRRAPSAAGSQELRAIRTGNGWIFSGYALKWGRLSSPITGRRGTFRETIRRGAFAKALAAGADIRLLLDHEPRVLNVLASTGTGALQIVEDDIGLAFLANVPDTQVARDVAQIVRSNRIGVSIAFTAESEEWGTAADGGRVRTITEMSSLEEVSLVVDPAYDSSEVSATQAAGSSRRSRATVDVLARELDLLEVEHAITLNPAAAIRGKLPPRHVDGRFHDGSPENRLLAAVGKASRAHEQHAAACRAYREAAAGAPDAVGTKSACLDWHEARECHRAAIEEARAAAENFLSDHQARWSSPAYADPTAAAAPEAAGSQVL